MSDLRCLIFQLIIFSVVAVIVLVLLYRRGVMGRRRLTAAPPRSVQLGGQDLIFTLVLMAVGWMIVRAVVTTWMPTAAEQPLADQPPGHYAMLMLIAQASMTPLIVFVIWRVATQPHGLSHFGLIGRQPWRDLGLGVIALAAAMPVVSAVGIWVGLVSELWIEPVPAAGHEMLEVISRGVPLPVVLTLFFSAVVVAPLIEEIIYRGLIQTVLLNIAGRSRRWSVVVVASVCFTMVHATVPWQTWPQLFVLSLYLGWLYEATGSLWPSIVLHLGFNAINFTWVWLTF